MAFKSVNDYGLDADIARKMNEKYDPKMEEQTQVWIENITGITFDKPFAEMLHDGIVLCRLVNALIPGRIKKINESCDTIWKKQENISAFLKVCKEIGVETASLFTSDNLVNGKDMNQVLTGIAAFSHKVQQRRDELGVTYNGPMLGPAPKVAAQPKEGKKYKFQVKPGGSSTVSLLNQGSHGIMEATKHTDAREAIKRNQLDGKGTGKGNVALNAGSQGMERITYVDPREQIKMNQLDGKGSGQGTVALNAGSVGMERLQYVDPREQIKRNQLDGKGTGQGTVALNAGSVGMERQLYVDPREQIKRNVLDGKGSDNSVSILNEGSKGMERQQYTDVRETIKKGEL